MLLILKDGKGDANMNGRQIANLIAEWADKNGVDSRDLQRMSFASLMDILIKDKGDDVNE